MKIAYALILIVAAACGNKSKSEPAKPEGGDKHAEEHAKMSPEVTKFHDVLAPRWHAAKGEQRMKDTCAAMTDFQSNAEALAKATPPAGADAAKWTTGTKELTDAVGALDATCKSNDAMAFEPAFERVHTGFHAVMELSAGEKHREGEHAEHKMSPTGEAAR
jgi:hypothetical protein